MRGRAAAEVPEEERILYNNQPPHECKMDLSAAFFSSDSGPRGKCMSNSILRSPRWPARFEIGIPSPRTTLTYCGFTISVTGTLRVRLSSVVNEIVKPVSASPSEQRCR